MTYNTLERSTYLGAPVELYEFQTARGTWYITSGDVSVIYDNNTYVPVSIKRSGIKQTQELESGGVDITIDAMNDIIYGFTITNAIKPVKVIIRRFQRRASTVDVRIIFKGAIVAVPFENEQATIKALMCNAAFIRKCPKLTYQKWCNHVIYSQRCGINKEDPAYKITDALITSVSSNILKSAAFATKPDGFFSKGYIEYDGADIGIQMVTIQSHTGDTIELLQPLRAAHAGIRINAYAGCDRTSTMCRDKFNNSNNYMGWEFIPIRNPFKSGMQD